MTDRAKLILAIEYWKLECTYSARERKSTTDLRYLDKELIDARLKVWDAIDHLGELIKIREEGK